MEAQEHVYTEFPSQLGPIKPIFLFLLLEMAAVPKPVLGIGGWMGGA